MFFLKNNVITEFEIPINEFLKKQGHSCGSQITETSYALGAITGGIIICDNKGNSIQTIDKKSLLQDESINALYTDKDNSCTRGVNLVNIFFFLFFCKFSERWRNG